MQLSRFRWLVSAGIRGSNAVQEIDLPEVTECLSYVELKVGFPDWQAFLEGAQGCVGNEFARTLRSSRKAPLIEGSELSLDWLLGVSSHATNIIQYTTSVKGVFQLIWGGGRS